MPVVLILGPPDSGDKTVQPLQGSESGRSWIPHHERLPSIRTRNSAAVRSSDKASARTLGSMPVLFRAPRSFPESYSDFRLFHSVLRFCPNANLRKLINGSSGT